MATLAPKLPYSHPFAGGYPRLGGQPLPTDPDAIDYLERVKAADGGVAVEVGVAMAVDAFVKGCKSDSAGYAGDPTRTVWDALQACCIMCGARTISGALVPLVGTAPTPYNFASGDYDRSGGGLKGDGATKYLDSNRSNDADGKDDFHCSVYVTQVSTSGTSAPNWFPMYIGTAGGSSGALAIGRNQNNSADLFFRNRTSTASFVPGATATGFLGNSRDDGGEYNARVGGADSVISQASQTPSGANVGVFRSIAADTTITYNNGRLAFYSIGSAIPNLAALDNRVSTLVAAIAAAI